MKNQEVNIKSVVFKIIDILILKIFTLPYKVYHNALLSLSNYDKEDSDETNLSSDFPLYVWFVSTYNAYIVLTYPIGLLVGLIYLILSNSFGIFLLTLMVTYFSPLVLGIARELIQLTLKNLLYLKLISKNTKNEN